MTAAAIMNIPRFDRADWALRYAYMAESMKGNPSMNMKYPCSTEGLDEFQYFIKRLTEDMNTQDIIADGVMLKNTIVRAISQRGGRYCHWTIGAKYRIPNDDFLRYMKDSDYLSLAGAITELQGRPIHKWFVVDVIRGYFEGTDRMHKSMEDWSSHLSVPYKTLARWSGSRDAAQRSIKEYLRTWESQALGIATERLREIGELQ